MKTIIIIILITCMFAGTAIFADNRSGEEINWRVISSGGTDGRSTNYGLKGTVSQTATGNGTSDNYGMNHGF